MTQPVDPVTLAITGHLPFNLLVAAVLTWPIALALLRLYTRAVRRSMRSAPAGSQGRSSLVHPENVANATAGRTAARSATLYDVPQPALSQPARRLVAELLARPWRAAMVYALAGGAYALVIALAMLMADGLEIMPLRLTLLTWTFLWPVVPTVAIVAVSTRRGRLALAAAYLAGLIIIGGVAVPRNPDLTWLQVFTPWALYDLPPSVLLLTYLSRRIRAVGPLILTFILLAVVGSDVVVTAAGSRDSALRTIVGIADSVGLGAIGTLVALLAVGFIIFSLVGWAALNWIRRRYQAKKISDESVTVDAIWTLFATVHSIDLVFGHPIWVFGGPAAFAAYKLCARAGFAWLGRRPDLLPKAPTLLVLRSFSIGRDSELLFDIVGRHWRRIGSIQMIAGADLVSRTVEPHEFLDFVSGKLSRRFIDGAASLARRVSERDLAADRDLRFRINEFFCHENTWKSVLSRLVGESDVVLMDLRGFSRQNIGCVFELHELAERVPLDRVIFIVDRRTDMAVLAETLGDRRVGVFRSGAMTGRQIRELLRALAAAASGPAAVAV